MLPKTPMSRRNLRPSLDARSLRCRSLVATVALLASACVGGSKEVSEKDKERLQAYVLDSAPADVPHKLDIDFDGKLRLVGYRLEPKGTVKPGQKVSLTMYWKVEKAIGSEGWNLFTHVIDGAGERILNIDNVGPLREWRETRQVMWPSAWQAGKVYVDEQEFTVPRNVKTNKIQVVTGAYKEAERLKISKGANVGENRALVATIATKADSPEPPVNIQVPRVRVDKLEKGVKIKIDGKLDEEAWRTAPTVGPFVDVRTGRPNTSFPVNGTAKLLWSDEGAYFGFDVKDKDVVGGFDPKQKDPHLWTKDCVELMIDPEGDGDNKDYYEIQINPQNLVFDSRFDDYNAPRKEPDGPFGHQDWSAKQKSAVEVKGTLDKSDDQDEGYVVEVMIPWKSFDKAKTTPPEIGTEWRVNLYAMQQNSGVAWSPILNQGNFHKSSRFGKILWAEKGWVPPAAAAAMAASSASGAPGASAEPPAPAPVGSVPLVMPRLDRSNLPRLRLPEKGPKPAN